MCTSLCFDVSLDQKRTETTRIPSQENRATRTRDRLSFGPDKFIAIAAAYPHRVHPFTAATLRRCLPLHLRRQPAAAANTSPSPSPPVAAPAILRDASADPAAYAIDLFYASLCGTDDDPFFSVMSGPVDPTGCDDAAAHCPPPVGLPVHSW